MKDSSGLRTGPGPGTATETGLRIEMSTGYEDVDVACCTQHNSKSNTTHNPKGLQNQRPKQKVAEPTARP